MPKPPPDSLLSRTESQVSCQLELETIILQPTSGSYSKLNEVGTRIWQLIEQPRRVSELLDAVQSEFAVDQQTCETEVSAFIDTLVRKKLAKLKEPSTN